MTVRAGLLLLVAVALASLMSSPPALGQDGVIDVDEPTATVPGSASPGATGSDSFAGRFFIVKKRMPGSDEEKVEVLGSVIIWFLLMLSVLSIGLIGFMALTNQRASILPAGVVGQARRLLADGRYREAIELTEREQSFFSQVLAAALREANHGFSAIIRSLEQN